MRVCSCVYRMMSQCRLVIFPSWEDIAKERRKRTMVSERAKWSWGSDGAAQGLSKAACDSLKRVDFHFHLFNFHISIHFYRLPSIYIYFHLFSSMSIRLHPFPSIFHLLPSMSIYVHLYFLLFPSIYFHLFPSMSIYFLLFPSISIYICSSISIYVHLLPSISFYFHLYIFIYFHLCTSTSFYFILFPSILYFHLFPSMYISSFYFRLYIHVASRQQTARTASLGSHSRGIETKKHPKVLIVGKKKTRRIWWPCIADQRSSKNN